MNRLKQFITEIHRRSLWQVLLIYVGAAWACFELIDAVTERFGFPEWLPALAVVLFLLGLPFVVATACVHELPARAEPPAEAEAGEVAQAAAAHLEARRRHRFLTWRNAAATFVIVLAAWGVVATGWLILGERAASADEERQRIAVLPLENLSPDPDNAFFAAGIHEDILSQLSKIRALDVISRTTVLQYADTDKGIQTIAEELGVDGIVEGSVRRAGDQVRVVLQLIDKADVHLWSETYDRDLTVANVFAIQSDIAQQIAQALEAELTSEERERIEARPTDNLEAYDFYLRGTYHLAKFTVDGANRAIEYFEEAIESDPTYPAPHAGLAIAWLYLGQPLGAVRHSEAMPKSKAAAEKALSLDPDLANAHMVLGQVSFLYDWDWQKAERLLQRAIELDPSSALAHRAYGVYLADAMGRYEEGIAEGIRAVEVDPLSLSERAILAEFYFAAGQYEQALGEALSVLDMDPGFDRARGVILWVYEELGMCEEYLALRRELLMGSGAEPEAVARLAGLEQACADSGFVGVWRWRLERNLEMVTAGEYVPPTDLARDYARLGQMDEAFQWLERAYEERDGNLALLKAWPRYEPLRSDPRVEDLLRRMNFPE